MLGDMTVPIEERKDWVWEQIGLAHPEFKRENFPEDDPYALHEIVVRNCYQYTPKLGDRVMDIGANIGIFTAFCALNGCEVWAYEPNFAALKVLDETVRRNGLETRVHALSLAVWVHTGTCVYHPTSTPPREPLQTWTSFNGSVNTPGASPDEKTPCIEFSGALGVWDWDCVKMDIEGAEFPLVLGTSDEALSRIKYLTVELHPGHADQEMYDAFVARLERVFTIDGVRDGDRWGSMFCTRK